MSRTSPNASAEVKFSTRILTSFSNSKKKFFKRMAGMIVLQKLEKAVVHSGDITLNICFFKVGKR